MALQEGKLDRTVYKLPAGGEKSQKFIFEELERIPRSTDFRDVIVALKHVVNKRQTSRFSVIILIYYKNRLQNAGILVERIVRKLTNSQSKVGRECF